MCQCFRISFGGLWTHGATCARVVCAGSIYRLINQGCAMWYAIAMSHHNTSDGALSSIVGWQERGCRCAFSAGVQFYFKILWPGPWYPHSNFELPCKRNIDNPMIMKVTACLLRKPTFRTFSWKQEKFIMKSQKMISTSFDPIIPSECTSSFEVAQSTKIRRPRHALASSVAMAGKNGKPWTSSPLALSKQASFKLLRWGFPLVMLLFLIDELCQYEVVKSILAMSFIFFVIFYF